MQCSSQGPTYLSKALSAISANAATITAPPLNLAKSIELRESTTNKDSSFSVGANLGPTAAVYSPQDSASTRLLPLIAFPTFVALLTSLVIAIIKFVTCKSNGNSPNGNSAKQDLSDKFRTRETPTEQFSTSSSMDKFVLSILRTEEDAQDESMQYCLKMVNALNNGYGSSSMIEIDDLIKFQGFDHGRKLTYMKDLFEAVVVYPFILKTINPTKMMVDMLQQQIRERFYFTNPTLDEKELGLMMTTLNKYFASVERYPGIDDILQKQDVNCPLGNFEQLVDSIENDSFFINARSIENFPPLLLPKSKKNTRKNESPDFSNYYRCISTRDMWRTRYHVVQQLPFLYIIATVASNSRSSRPMTQEEKNKLTTDLSAAKEFYQILSGVEKTQLDLEGYNLITFSENIIRRIDRNLACVQKIDCTPAAPQDQSIYKFLVKFHLGKKLWRALHTFIRIGDSRGSHNVAAADLINFCRAFNYEGMLDSHQVAQLKRVMEFLPSL